MKSFLTPCVLAAVLKVSSAPVYSAFLASISTHSTLTVSGYREASAVSDDRLHAYSSHMEDRPRI
ncbi:MULTISPECIES: hypothetical protein [Paraburkholderia]|uniref:hypothetical protein n=1 Tax=Paraburkholderia TaxID=1822464 RepID=UPI00224E1B45|nr:MULTISPECIES: hypothetical protein [Paraburkholderia]MCX4159943.1 hypothetical protein [Paraburkholderia megapolitana]MDN7155443.1 hypothetical protein [Paraburkholderia sp. CHISQ3]MDQ6492487.1 hypothetical protein [Paraburkholderia megapolitana]